MLKHQLKILALLSIVAGMCCVKSELTGTSDETLIKSARVLNPDFSFAPNVEIRLFEVNDTTRVPAYRTTTDQQGSYSIKVHEGVYNVLAGDSTLAAFQDSVIVKSSYCTLRDDTLESTGTLLGTVIMEPIHDPRTTTIQIVGTDKFSNVAENGTFKIAGLARGDYTIRSVSTLTAYTPTFTGFLMNPSVDSIARVSIHMVYTGIPIVRNIHAVYDTLLNEVTLTWDTLSYFLLKDFLIYRDTGNYLIPSIAPIASCTMAYSYVDKIVPQGTSSITYRMAVRTKTLEIGQTYETAVVRSQQPPALSLIDPVTCYFGVPCTLKAVVTGYTGSSIVYAWNIGGKGFQTESGPFKIITVTDTAASELPCIVKVTIDNKLTLLDTAHLVGTVADTTPLAVTWTKVAPAITSALEYHAVELNGRLLAFCKGAAQESIWSSLDGLSWTKITDSLTIPFHHSKPVAFHNALCAVDDSGYLWTSNDAVLWNKVAVPIIVNSFLVPEGAGPMMFGDNDTLYLQAVRGTVEGTTIFFTEDLVHWSKREMPNHSFIFGFAEMNGARLYLESDTVFSQIYSVISEGTGPDTWKLAGTSSSRCEVFKGTFILYDSRFNLLWIYDKLTSQWNSGALPPSGTTTILVTFKQDLYAISNEGIWKAVQ